MLFFVVASNSFAQTPGLIFDPATNPGDSVLDPNLDGYVSDTDTGFVTNDEIESEIPYTSLVFPADEINNDLCLGPPCGFTDFVQQAVGLEDACQQYLDADDNWLFRMRFSGAANNSKSYSILIDTDQKFGLSGPNADTNYLTGNPGFEIELLLATNFGVYIYDVDGTTTPVLKKSYPGQTNYQRSVALTTNCDDPDYFYDFFVPFSDLTTYFSITPSTPVRIVILSNMAAHTPSIGKFNTVSDVGGTTCSFNFDIIIDDYTPTCDTCPPGLDRTTCPYITSPIMEGATSVSGTSTEPNGTVIKIFKNGVVIGRDTITGGVWSLTGISPALIAGNIIEASATAPGKGESIRNCNAVTVADVCTASLDGSKFTVNAKGVCGSAGAGIPGATFLFMITRII
ncbi:MAG: hypothetical protein HGB12_12995 [Bacteroidetes bacterium]|nr:hypothetical protein [Bacteroidota bacterium]